MKCATAAAIVLACGAHGCATPARAPLSGSEGLAIGWNQAVCFQAATDTDSDGVDDNCELAVAAAFAPLLVVNPSGCNWDTTVKPPRLGGGYLFAVQRVGDAVRVAYLPAYFRDCGWSGVKCALPGVDCEGHAGDSEMIALDIVVDGAERWRTTRVFLSAHCFGRTGASCRWYEADQFAEFAWYMGRTAGAPVVWVAEGRQANYPSRRACDAGHHAIDTCDRHTLAYRFPIYGNAQNIGSAQRPAAADGCMRAADMPLRSALTGPGTECFWTERAFRGWQEADGGTTAYAYYLATVAGF